MYWMHEILHFIQNDKHAIFMIATQSLKGRGCHEITRVQILSGLVARCVLPKTSPPPLVGEKNVGSKLVLIYVILILSNCVILNFARRRRAGS